MNVYCFLVLFSTKWCYLYCFMDIVFALYYSLAFSCKYKFAINCLKVKLLGCLSSNMTVTHMYKNLLDPAWLNRFLYKGVLKWQIPAKRFLSTRFLLAGVYCIPNHSLQFYLYLIISDQWNMSNHCDVW